MRLPAAIARPLEPLVSSLGVLFFLWTGMVLAVWTFSIGEVQITTWVSNKGLRSALLWVIHILDPLWLTLGATNIYLSLAKSDGLGAARRWCGIVVLVFFAAILTNSAAAFPFGPLHYTQRLGPSIGPMPFVALFLAIILVIGAREMAVRFLTRASHWQIACITGLAVGAAQLLVDPVAWRTRSWWQWLDAVERGASFGPPRTFVAWCVLAAICAYLMRLKDIFSTVKRRPATPIVVLTLVLIVFAAMHLVHWVQRIV